MNKKSIAPVIAVSLLIIIAVSSVTLFNTWFNDYQSKIQTNVETTSNIEKILKIEKITPEILYLYSSENENLSYISIKNSLNEEICSFNLISIQDSNDIYFWYRADSFKNYNNADTISSWEDQSRNNIDATQTLNQSWRPKYYSSSLNGKPTLYFDGVNDGLAIPQFSSGNRSLFLVSDRSNMSAGSSDIISTGRGGATPGSFEVTTNGNVIGWNDSGINVGGPTLNYGNSIYIQSIIFSSSGINIYKNSGGNINSSNHTFTLSTNQAGIGGRNLGAVIDDNARVNVSEVIFFNSSVNNNTRIQVETYLAEKYNLILNNSLEYNITKIQLNQGVNELRIKSCNIEIGEKYSIFAYTNSQKIESILIAK